MFQKILKKPDVFSEKEARRILESLKKLSQEDNKYYFGDIALENISEETARKYIDRIYSIPRRDLEDLVELKNNAQHYRLFPWLFGTYEPDINRHFSKFVFADFTGFDVAIPIFARGIILPYSILRGIYYLGRENWWRHEMLHAKHHFAAEKYMERKEYGEFLKAFYFIHESGLEELVTRWQSYKEAVGKREKILSTLALLLYLEYSPFTSFRNLFISLKETFDEK